MTEVIQPRCAVMSDTHGQFETVARAVEAEEPINDLIIFAGDMADGPDTARLVQLIMDLGSKAIGIVGNHEWALRNALSESDDPAVEIWRDDIWPGYHSQTLESYGVDPTNNWANNAKLLREAMDEVGHLEWLNDLPTYASFDDFVVVHAGPELDQPWFVQAAQLDRDSMPDARLQTEPPQLFSHELARLHNVPAEVDSRTFVSGHNHLPAADPQQRIADRRVCLGSSLARGMPLFVWHNDGSGITSYPNDK